MHSLVVVTAIIVTFLYSLLFVTFRDSIRYIAFVTLLISLNRIHHEYSVLVRIDDANTSYVIGNEYWLRCSEYATSTRYYLVGIDDAPR